MKDFLKMTMAAMLGALFITGCNLFASSPAADTTQLTAALQALHIQAYPAKAVQALAALRSPTHRHWLSMGEEAYAAPVAVASLGTVCGYMLNGVPAQPNQANEACVLLANNGQMVNFDLASGKILPSFTLYYTSTDCGVGGHDAPFLNPNESFGPVAQPRGLIFRDQSTGDSDTTTYWQVTSTATLQTVNIASARSAPNGICGTASVSQFQGYQAIPNTTAINGITNQPIGAIAID